MTVGTTTPAARDRPAARVTGRGIAEGARGLAPLAVIASAWGVAFGAAAIDKGLAPAQAILMSATVFAGGSQFAALEVWTHPLPYLSIALVVFLVNARHIVLGAALGPVVNPLTPGRRFLVLSVLSDANFAVGQAEMRAGRTDVGFVLGGGLALWTAWVGGTLVGVLAGNALAPLDRFGIDVTLGAFLGAIVIGQVAGERRQALPVALAAAVALAAFPVLPTGWNVILAALAGGLAAALRRDG